MGTGSLPLINPPMSATDAQIAEESMFWVRNLADWFAKYLDDNVPLLTEIAIKWSKSVQKLNWKKMKLLWKTRRKE